MTSRAGSRNKPNVSGAGDEGTGFGLKWMPRVSALLVVARGPNTVSQFLLNRSVTSAGRHPNSDIFLDDVTVSRNHAEFWCQNGEFEVVDVGSLNGTYVNGECVESAKLVDGDELQIGKFRLRYLLVSTTDNPAS